MFKLYLVDEEDNEHWVWSFPSVEEAETFMSAHNKNNYDYVIREEKADEMEEQ
jgi:hypothetical protein